MIDPIGARFVAPTPLERSDQDKKLREVASQLEGVFVQQMFKAMRESVPQGEGIVSGGTGEELFTSLMDQHLAAETPKHWGGGLAEAVYKHLRGGLAPLPETSDLTETPGTSHPIVR